MPDIRPRRKSVPLVSELVRNQLSIYLANVPHAYMDMYNTYTGRRYVLAAHIRGNEEQTVATVAISTRSSSTSSRVDIRSWSWSSRINCYFIRNVSIEKNNYLRRDTQMISRYDRVYKIKIILISFREMKIVNCVELIIESNSMESMGLFVKNKKPC